MGKASPKEGREQACGFLGKGVAGSRSSKCKGPGVGACLGSLRSSKEAGVEQTRVTGEETRPAGGRGGQIMRSLTGHNITSAFILSEVRSHVRGF